MIGDDYDDYSVTWKEVKRIVDKMLDGEKKVAMCDINHAIQTAWNKLYIELRMKYKRAEQEKRDKWVDEQLR